MRYGFQRIRKLIPSVSTRLSSTCIQNRLATRARYAVAKIDKSLKHLHDLELEVLINIFDTQVKQILLHGAEVWSMCNDTSVIENVHLNPLKRFLKVPFITPNALVYGDTGRHELYIRRTICSIRYWLKILKMNDSRYVKKVVILLYKEIDLITTHNLYVHSALSMKKIRLTFYYNVLYFMIYD